jgi:hypothetical protein
MCPQQQGSSLKLRGVRKKAKGVRQSGFYRGAPAMARVLTSIGGYGAFETE